MTEATASAAARPTLHAEGPRAQELQRLFAAALDTVEGNIVAGRGPDEPADYLRAGGGYDDPWTRDAAINAWQAGSLLHRDVARDTLLMVCQDGADGLVVAQDDQWWDQVIWIVAAWQHYLVTGDGNFLATAYSVGVATMAIAETDRRSAWPGLFVGPAVMQDGISGYPSSVVSVEHAASSFVLDHPESHSIMCLSTNVIHVMAYSALADMADALGADGTAHRAAAANLALLVERHLWSAEDDQYAYIVDAYGGLDLSTEALGIALLILSGTTSQDRARRLVEDMPRQPRGVVSVWPHQQDFSDSRPGRHNGSCWPMIMGYWAQAVAAVGDQTNFGTALADLVDLVSGSDGRFFEVYNAIDGSPDGGWQVGRRWASEPEQTWSATAFVGTVLLGALGLRYLPDGLCVSPVLPGWLPSLTVDGLPYRGSRVSVTAVGQGSTVTSVTVDGTPVDPAARVHLPSTANGHHHIEVHCVPA